MLAARVFVVIVVVFVVLGSFLGVVVDDVHVPAYEVNFSVFLCS